MSPDKHPDRAYHDMINITYLGPMEREGTYPLDWFHDNLTGASFLRLPIESLDEAVARVRKEANNAKV